MGIFGRKPAPENGQTRVDLSDDQWVIFHKEVLHKTFKAVGELTRKYLKPSESAKKIEIGEGEVRATVKSEMEIDVAAIDWDSVTDVIILNQAVQWSFGEVDAEVLGNLPHRVHQEIAAAVDELWKDAELGPLAITGVGS